MYGQKASVYFSVVLSKNFKNRDLKREKSIYMKNKWIYTLQLAFLN
jgi:hypothetical protein